MRLEAQVDAAEALSYLGHAGQDLGSDLAARFERAVSLVNAITPQGMARTFPVAESGESGAVRLEGTAFELEGHDIARHLRGAREVVLIVVTLGLESESLLRREAILNPTDGLLVDACASSLVESAANEMSRLVEKRACERGMRVGSRFSPGYGDFPLSCQRAFLDAVGAAKALGISVTRGDLLVPSKSITAVAGLYVLPKASVGECAALAGDAAAAGASGYAADAAAGTGVAAAAAAAAAAADAGIVPPPSQRSCATCKLVETCLLRAQGRTCYGRS